MAKAKPKPSSKAKTAAKSKPKTAVKAKAPAKAKPAAKPPAKKPAPAKAKTAPTKAAKAVQSALEPKANGSAKKPKTGAVSAKARNGSRGDTDTFEATRPGTAAFRRAAAMPVTLLGSDGSKSPFAERELKEWRALLLEKRSELTDDIAGLVKDAMEAEDGHTTPNHIAERGSDADLQDMSLGMAGQEEIVLWEIDRALRKIDEARPLPFGLCEFTKQPISKNRLQLMPWTPLSIEGAQHMEENHLTMEDLLLDD